MKTVILASSIFFILGLKVSSTIDLTPQATRVDTMKTQQITPAVPGKPADVPETPAPLNNSDSLKGTEEVPAG